MIDLAIYGRLFVPICPTIREIRMKYRVSLGGAMQSISNASELCMQRTMVLWKFLKRGGRGPGVSLEVMTTGLQLPGLFLQEMNQRDELRNAQLEERSLPCLLWPNYCGQCRVVTMREFTGTRLFGPVLRTQCAVRVGYDNATRCAVQYVHSFSSGVVSPSPSCDHSWQQLLRINRKRSPR